MPETYKQVAQKLSSTGSVLLVLAPLPTPDAVAAGLALSGYLKRMGKDVTVVSSDGTLNPRVDFLSGYGSILRELDVSKAFVIDVSTKRTPISELSYKKENDKISIYLKPKSGQFEPSDVNFRSAKYPYDVVVTIGVSSLDGLGELYAKFAELFFETPVINIDYRGSNEGFGQFNLIQLNATSQSEIVYDLISELDKDLIDSDIATSLLAGIISETNSFQHSRTTPQSFMKASQLISAGGRQQDIVNHMFKNQSMGFLKLWGRVLARIKHEPDSSLIYSAVNQVDVLKSGALNEDVAAILKEMVSQLTFAKIHVFLRELSTQETEVYIASPATLNLQNVFNQYQPEISQPQSLKFTLPQDLASAEKTIIENVREQARKLA